MIVAEYSEAAGAEAAAAVEAEDENVIIMDDTCMIDDE
jgi:hypothetical protein